MYNARYSEFLQKQSDSPLFFPMVHPIGHNIDEHSPFISSHVVNFSILFFLQNENINSIIIAIISIKLKFILLIYRKNIINIFSILFYSMNPFIINKKFIIGIIVAGCIVIILHFIYFKSNVGRDKNFITLINIYIGCCTFITIYSILLNNKINYANIINNQLSNITPLFQNITENISNFFTTNPSMNYYYNELFNGINNEDETIRNIILEEVISNNILIYIDTIINYIDSYKISNGTNFQLRIMETKLSKLLDKLLSSKIFTENWYKFKKILALDWTKTYMLINYGK